MPVGANRGLFFRPGPEERRRKLIDQILTEQENAYRSARDANLDRYNTILGGRTDTRQRVLDEINTLGTQQKADVNTAYDKALGDSLASLYGSGFGLSSDNFNYRRQNATDKTNALRRVEEDIAARRANADSSLSDEVHDFMERRTDEYPDSSNLNRLLYQLSTLGTELEDRPRGMRQRSNRTTNEGSDVATILQSLLGEQTAAAPAGRPAAPASFSDRMAAFRSAGGMATSPVGNRPDVPFELFNTPPLNSTSKEKYNQRRAFYNALAAAGRNPQPMGAPIAVSGVTPGAMPNTQQSVNWQSNRVPSYRMIEGSEQPTPLTRTDRREYYLNRNPRTKAIRAALASLGVLPYGAPTSYESSTHFPMDWNLAFAK